MPERTIPNLRRRRLTQAAALGTLVTLGAGCATPTSAAKPRVVVVGGGWGGLGAIRGLAPGGRVAVTLIEPHATFSSCPMSALYVAGLEPVTYLQRDFRNVDALGVQRLRERAVAIDRTARVVVTDTRRVPYDFLVLSPGVAYMEEALPGFAEGRDLLPVGFRPHEHSAVKQQVDRFLVEGGNLVMSVPRPPYRCPPAPFERAFLIAEQMQRRGTRGRIIILDANAAPTPQPIARPILNSLNELYTAQIDYRPESTITRIDAARRTVTTGAGEIRYTAANFVPPMRAPDLIRQAGLGERWANVELPSFRSVADPRVYVIGDSQGSPLPKSGHVAFGAGKTVADAILAQVAGTPRPEPRLGERASLPTGICWAKVSATEAIMISVTASVEPGSPAALSFQVDQRHNAASKRGSRQWADDMWGQMLG
jgi:NADH dehydrogenase FAD-containing subunit